MTLRVARHTENLEKVKSFYIATLGFELLGSFENHDGYDGIFIGKAGADWHFEFTVSAEKARHQADEDDLIVLYPESQIEYDRLLKNLASSDIGPISAKNPYWNANGQMYTDPDGFRIVISNQKITL